MDEEEQVKLVRKLRYALTHGRNYRQIAFDETKDKDLFFADPCVAPYLSVKKVIQFRFDLEKSWSRLPSGQIDKRLRELKKVSWRESFSRNSFVLPAIAEWLGAFDDFPPPELLLALAALFRKYMDAGGALTLEEVFFGKPLKNKGTYAARQAKLNPSLQLGYDLAYLYAKTRGLSDNKAAAAAQAELEAHHECVPDADAYLKRRRREKNRSRRVRTDKA